MRSFGKIFYGAYQKNLNEDRYSTYCYGSVSDHFGPSAFNKFDLI